MVNRVYGIKSGFKNLFLRGLGKKRVLFATIDVTNRCICKCITCPVWKMKEVFEPSVETEKLAMRKLRDAGVVVLVITGGEPLLRNDIDQIVKYSYNCGFVTSIVTNGFLLSKKIDSFYKYVDRVCVSLDSSKPKVHNMIRGIDVFDKAVEGVKKTVSLGTLTLLNCVISKYNLDHIEEVLFLGEKLGANGVMFDPMQTMFFGENFDHLKFNPKEQELFKEKIQLLLDLKKEGHRVMNTTPYLKYLLNPEKFGVKCDLFGVSVGWDAKICPLCNRFHKKGFSLGKISVNDFLDRKDLKKSVEKMAMCTECSASCVWEPILSLGSLRGFIGMGSDVIGNSYWDTPNANDNLHWVGDMIGKFTSKRRRR
jgi:MoaA/NifB/PqqE/SkfB family radical SAM enzyme